MDVWRLYNYLPTKKVNLCFSNEKVLTDLRNTWYVGVVDTSTTHVIYHHQMRILFSTSFAYLFWLANNILTGKYPEFCIGYCDESWYIGSGGYKYYPCGLLSPNAHI